MTDMDGAEPGGPASDGRPERLTVPDWGAGSSWMALIGLGMTLGLVLGALNHFVQGWLEDLLAVAPPLEPLRNMAVMAGLFGLGYSIVRTLENPLGSYRRDDPWWDRQRKTVGWFPAGLGPSLLYMALVPAASTAAYLFLCRELGQCRWLVLLLQGPVAVCAALYPPLRLLRWLARPSGLSHDARRRSFTIERRRD